VERSAVDRRRGSALLLVLLSAVCLVAALSMDPGSGTGTNLQPAADVGGMVAGDHHAKPMPQVASIAALIAALAAAVLHAVWSASPSAAAEGLVRPVDGPPHGVRLAAGWRSSRARRGPPVA
jgi:hypothetical protein